MSSVWVVRVRKRKDLEQLAYEIDSSFACREDTFYWGCQESSCRCVKGLDEEAYETKRYSFD